MKRTTEKPVWSANADAPERGQHGAAQAMQRFQRLIGGQEVRIDTVARDNYGRAVAKVYVYSAHKSINKKMRGKRAKQDL